MAKSKFDDLAAQLNQQTEEAVIAKAESVKELIATATTNLNQLKAFIDEGSVSGEDLKTLIDSMASFSGKTLAEERIGGPEGKTVKEALNDLLEKEAEYGQAKQLLLSNAKKLKIDLETYLANTENPLLRQVVTIKDEAERMAAELRVGIKTFAMSLVDHLQENNTQKGLKSDAELIALKAIFSPVESEGAKTHESQETDIVAKFVETQGVTTKQEVSWGLAESIERKRISKEVVWNNYANKVKAFLEAQLPEKEDEEKRRDFLRKFLDFNAPIFRMSTYHDHMGVAIEPLIAESFSKETLRPLVLEYFRTVFLASKNIERSSAQDSLYVLAIARSEDMTRAAMIRGIAESLGNPARDLTDDITNETAKLETSFLNDLDTMTEFLFAALPKNNQLQVTDGVGDYRLFSPIWEGGDKDATYPKHFVPRVGLPMMEEGALYAPIKLKDRTSDLEATQAKEAFAQKLSTALNKTKLQEDHVVLTSKDRAKARERKMTAAEQRMLAAETAATKAAGTMRALEAKLAESESALTAERNGRAAENTAAAAREATLKTTVTGLQTENGTLTAEKAALKLQQKGLVETERRLAEAEKELARIKAGLENAVATSGFMGTSKKVLQNLLTPPVQE